MAPKSPPPIIEWPSEVFAGSLGGQRLPDSRRAEQVDHETLALPLHKIVKVEVGVVRLCEQFQEVAPVARKHEVVVGFVRPLDGMNLFNIELDLEPVSRGTR